MNRRLLGIVFGLAFAVAACGGSAAGSTTTAPAASSSTAVSTSLPPTTTPETSTTSPPSTTTTTTVLEKDVLEYGQWVLVLASLPIDEFSLEDAAARTPEVDGSRVLLSNDYPSLNAGYWVVYAGPFPENPTTSACPQDRPEDFTCYPRFVGDLAVALPNIVIWTETGIRQVNALTGEYVGVSGDLDPGGIFIDRFAVNQEEQVAFFGVGWEDFWYSCEASRGTVSRADLSTGLTDVAYPGYNPQLSPDGSLIAVIDASECVPDPAQDGWWLTPFDQVQIYRLSQGIALPVATLQLPGPTEVGDREVSDIYWVDDQTLLVFQRDGTVRRASIDRPNLEAAPIIDRSETIRFPVTVVGQDVYYTDDNTSSDGSTRLYRRNLMTGAVAETDITTDAWIIGATNGSDYVIVESTNIYVNGTFLVDLGAEIWAVGW
jgi:hypothetical protein